MLLVSLLILLAQFAAVVHATDHLFHQEDVLCMAFQHAEQNKLFINAASLTVVNSIASNDLIVQTSCGCLAVSRYFYSSRAPPLSIA